MLLKFYLEKLHWENKIHVVKIAMKKFKIFMSHMYKIRRGIVNMRQNMVKKIVTIELEGLVIVDRKTLN